MQVVSDEKVALAGASRTKQSGNRISRMTDRTQKMADSYGAILQKIVDTKSLTDPATGTPYAPSADIIQTLRDTFDGLETDLGDERDTNQGLIDGAWGRVDACKNTRADAVAADPGGVTALGVIANTKRQEHSTCRDQEITAETHQVDSQSAFDGVAIPCQTGYEFFNKYDKSQDQGAGSLTDIINKASTLDAAVTSLATKAAECDGKQTDFEQAFCDHSNKVNQVCSQYETCFDTNKQDWQAVNTSVHELEASQKIMLKMLKKVECYINALAAAKDTMPTQDTINTCQALGTTAETAIDVSSLDITYKALPSKIACTEQAAVSHAPPGGFAAHEYANARFTGRVEQSRASC